MQHGFNLHQSQSQKPGQIPGLNNLDGDQPIGAGPPSQAWMITFADLVSLMLTFFVMLFAMSSVQVDQWDLMVDAMSRSMNPQTKVAEPTPSAKYNIGSVFRKRAINLDYLYGVLQDVITEDPLLVGASVHLLDDRMVISLPGGRMFPPEKAVLSDTAKQAVVTLGGILRNLTNQVGVMGHTGADSSGASYTSLWELSMARAAAVANALKSAGYAPDVQVFGAADTRLVELKDLPQEKQDRYARRVDIFILPVLKGQ